jgi:hypothetical protein
MMGAFTLAELLVVVMKIVRYKLTTSSGMEWEIEPSFAFLEPHLSN